MFNQNRCGSYFLINIRTIKSTILMGVSPVINGHYNFFYYYNIYSNSVYYNIFVFYFSFNFQFICKMFAMSI